MKRFIAKLLLLFAFVLVPKWNVQAQDAKFKALFIYNFTKLIEWPNETQETSFIITIYGNEDLTAELEGIAKKMKVGSRPIIVKRITQSSQLSNTHMLYVAKDKSTDLAQITESLKSKNILVISDKTNACSLGSSLNFISKNGNLNFEIHKANIEKAGLSVNSELYKLGSVL